MAAAFSMISKICFVASGSCLTSAIIFYFLLNTKSAYRELKERPEKGAVNVSETKKKKSRREAETEPLTNVLNDRKSGGFVVVKKEVCIHSDEYLR